MLRALDLFCGAGGASMGLRRAGFDVVGVDIKPQPNYPFEFHKGDAMEWPLEGFDLIWASPPCQRYITGGLVNRRRAPDLVGPVRDRLEASGGIWIIENVPGAPLRRDLLLCGSMFGLPLRRHRVFELSGIAPPLVSQCDHSRPVFGVYGHPHGSRGAWPGMLPGTLQTWRDAIGAPWMTAPELSQAIPPIYSETIAIPLSRDLSGPRGTSREPLER